jgi:hypothetical protein
MHKIKSEPKFKIGDFAYYKSNETDEYYRLKINYIKKHGKSDFFYSKDGNNYVAERYLKKFSDYGF